MSLRFLPGMTTSCVPNESLSVSSLTRSRVLRIEKVLIRKQERFVSRDIDFEAGAIAFATPALVFVLFRRRGVSLLILWTIV